ncbi:hypothetical protein HJFPF1_10104 [Paramyrothecium foliicola]|nr:hypothetical protein HJFPF1_10104 [Paramyrothecium foliicola]
MGNIAWVAILNGSERWYVISHGGEKKKKPQRIGQLLRGTVGYWREEAGNMVMTMIIIVTLPVAESTLYT